MCPSSDATNPGAGDTGDGAWSQQARRLLAKAQGAARQAGIHGFDSESVAVEALADLWRSKSESNGDLRIAPEEAEGLIWTIAKRRAADFLRREARHRRLGASGPAMRAEDSAQTTDPQIVESLERALSQLSPQERNIVELHFVHDLTYLQVAGLMGKDRAEVASMAARATRVLRECLDR